MKKVMGYVDVITVKSELEKEGFPFVYDWSDEGGTHYEEHAHKGKTVIYVVKGEGDFIYTDTGETIKLVKGMKFYPEEKRNHIAQVGSEGWDIIVGEMIDGDS